ncbi:hypothetical protein AMTR_s00025p00243770 [Amborella trichopoda]|uniref:Exo-beta-D-glucosaminidase Ig-fold domain-containing protein n=2 Tax=Amborella trichopoda TaxID=13333 RepID=W1PXI5_AMBTC|nr:hypothetical protein AMTR_s00025p00243770 [Amborella trichopoda]
MKQDDNDFDVNSINLEEEGRVKKRDGILRRIRSSFSREDNSIHVTERNGGDSGVAFFLHFSVNAAKKEVRDGEDTRILPVHYSDNYFSLAPGETMPVEIRFEAPPGVSPRVTLHGWNYHHKSISIAAERLN